MVPREPGQEEGGLGRQPRTATHHRKHHQPKDGSIVPPSGTDSKEAMTMGQNELAAKIRDLKGLKQMAEELAAEIASPSRTTSRRR